MIKRIFSKGALLLQIAIIAVIGVLIVNLAGTFATYVMSPGRAAMQPVIIIDAGHGDFDPGAIAADGTPEKDLNLQIALKLADFFRANGHTVVMTRADDTTLSGKGPSTSASRKRSDTQNRAYLADSYDGGVMISIHLNAFSDRSQHGTQVFYGQKNPESKALAEEIMRSVVAGLQPDNARECKRGYDTIYILRTIENPVVLVECGFITNSAELAALKDDDYQCKLAFCIYLGYLNYLQAADAMEN